MDRRVTDDDVMWESHKQIAQTNRTKQDDVMSKNGNDKQRFFDAPEQLRCVWST